MDDGNVSEMNVEKTLSKNQSLWRKYHLMLSELPKESPSVEKVTLVFQVLNELIEHFGVFKELMRELEKELIEAVYSTRMTTQASLKSKVIKRIPHFVLVDRLSQKESLQIEKLEESKEMLKQKLFEKQQQYEEIDKKLMAEKEERHILEKLMFEKTETIRHHEDEYRKIQRQMQKEKQEFSQREEMLVCEIRELRRELEKTIHERDINLTYKATYDNLQRDFQIWSDREAGSSESSSRLIHTATRKSHLLADLEACRKLEQQLLKVQNLTIEEFDMVSEYHKGIMSALNPAYVERNEEADRADEDYLRQVFHFHTAVEQINVELRRLQLHSLMLKEQIQNLNEAEEMTVASRSVITPQNLFRDVGAVDGIDLQTTSPEAVNDPFSIHERVLSKYAASIFFSANGGKTFNEIKEAKFCSSCGDKTLICPHVVGGQEKIIPLPMNCTHMKLVRPKVHLVEDVLKFSLGKLLLPNLSIPLDHQVSSTKVLDDGHGVSSSLQEETAVIPISRQSESRSGARTILSSAAETETSLQSNVSHLFKYDLRKIMQDLADRTPLGRLLPRTISLDRLMSLTEQFWASALWEDENGIEEQGFSCIMDKLFEFLYERYNKEEVVYLVAHDYIDALLGNESDSPFLQFVIHVFINNLDGAAFRYLLLLFELVDLIDWKHPEEFRTFITVTYPFLDEDDVEIFYIGFVSHSENKISKTSIHSYLLSKLLKAREPRFQEMENRLHQSSQQEVGYMNLREFTAVLELIVALPQENLAYRLFMESRLAANRESDIPENMLPISRLAQIVSYLELLQNLDGCRMKLVEDLRDMDIDAWSIVKDKSDSTEVWELSAFTYKKLKSLSINEMRSVDYRDQLAAQLESGVAE